jgi:hypothetical protein
MIAAGTYCVCNTGDHGPHGSATGNVAGQHLADKAAVVIRQVDKVTDVDLGPDKVPMSLASDGKELMGLVNYPHSRTAGGSENVLHQVRITRVEIDPNLTPGCLGSSSNKTTLKIQFCYRNPSNSIWECAPPSGDFGDTHVQN